MCQICRGPLNSSSSSCCGSLKMQLLGHFTYFFGLGLFDPTFFWNSLTTNMSFCDHRKENFLNLSNSNYFFLQSIPDALYGPSNTQALFFVLGYLETKVKSLNLILSASLCQNQIENFLNFSKHPLLLILVLTRSGVDKVKPKV